LSSQPLTKRTALLRFNGKLLAGYSPAQIPAGKLGSADLSLLKTPYMLPALLFSPSVYTLLADDIRPRFAPADCTKLRALTRRFAP